MLHLRLSADAKCPRHPRRKYDDPPAGCEICRRLADAQRRAVQLESELRAAARLGAELRWCNHRRAAKSVEPSSSAEPVGGTLRRDA